MRTLLFKPGELTLAYWRQQRMRYISPVSLYIFISALYFGCMILFLPLAEKKGIEIGKKMAVHVPQQPRKARIAVSPIPIKVSSSKFQDPAVLMEVSERIAHMLPKLFFFLIPMTAFILQLLFLKRKEIYYVDHLIFSIHFHSFYFFLGTLTTLINLLPASELNMIIGLATAVLSFLYFRQALQVVYQISGVRATWYTFVFGFAYIIVLIPLIGIAFYYAITHLH